MCVVNLNPMLLSNYFAAVQYVQVAIEMLRDNSQNLMSAVSEILYVTETATIRVPLCDRNKLGLKWVKK